jgi:NTP pyrophosphatase (non-canonical NTP hydrolase)
MNFEHYQEKARETAIYPEQFSILYPALGLAGEAGETCEKIKKMVRDVEGFDAKYFITNCMGNGELEERRVELKKEIGDTLWYLANLASDLDLNLAEIALDNLTKLNSQKERGVLKGSGDNR